MRKLLTLITGVVLTAGILFGTAATAGASTHPQACYGNEYGTQFCIERVFVDARSSAWVRLPFANQEVQVRYISGDMWSGRWFAPRNDATGYVNEPAPSGWPMPGAPAMSLVGHTYHWGHDWSATTAPVYIGTGRDHIRATAGYLVLQTNDNWKFDNDGGFIIEVLVYRR